MLAPKPISPQKFFTLMVVLGVALSAIGYLVYANFVRVSTAPPAAEWEAEFTRAARNRYPPAPPVNPVHPVFSSPQFLRLKSFVQLPVTAGEIGRENPFAIIPYLGETTTPPTTP